MDKNDFEDIFDEIVCRPLLGDGFIRRGRALYAETQGLQIAWVRGGGRFALPGAIAHCVCFRHAILRDKEGQLPAHAPSFPEQYPWVFDPERLAKTRSKDWRFDAARLMSLPYGRYIFDGVPEKTLKKDLAGRLAAFRKYTDWALSLSLPEAAAQLVPFAGDYWVARHWLEDYTQAIGRSHVG